MDGERVAGARLEGARELGLRPSIFVDVGAVWGIRRPVLETACGSETGCNIPIRDAAGNLQYLQVNALNADGTIDTTKNTIVTSPTNPNPPAPQYANNTLQAQTYRFVEEFLGNTWKPRVAIGIGVNWNSPFGPFRIDFSKVLLKQPGDDTKSFTFNVGTQF